MGVKQVESVNIWDTIFTFESAGLIALLGVVLAALISFGGILVNNHFESKRKKYQQQHNLVKETYFDALNHLSFFYCQVLKISSGKQVGIDEGNIAATYSFYKLILVASPDVIKNFTGTAGSFSACLYDLFEKLVILKKYEMEEKIAQDAIDFSINNMNEANVNLKNYHEENINRPHLFEGYQTMFDNAKKNYNDNSEIKEQMARKRYSAQVSLVREGIKKAVEISPAIYTCIFSMRRDLERQLHEKDMEQINQSINIMLEKLQDDTEGFISRMNVHSGITA